MTFTMINPMNSVYFYLLSQNHLAHYSFLPYCILWLLNITFSSFSSYLAVCFPKLSSSDSVFQTKQFSIRLLLNSLFRDNLIHVHDLTSKWQTYTQFFFGPYPSLSSSHTYLTAYSTSPLWCLKVTSNLTGPKLNSQHSIPNQCPHFHGKYHHLPPSY